jgi:hypothetical protein
MYFLYSTLLFCPNPGLPYLNYKLYKLFHICPQYFFIFYFIQHYFGFLAHAGKDQMKRRKSKTSECKVI